MNKIRIIGLVSSIIAIVLFSFGVVSDADLIGIAITWMIIGISVDTWRD